MNELVAVREGAGVHLADGRLVGNSLFAIDSGAADAFLAAVGPGAVALVSRTTPGVAVRDLPTVDRTRRLGEICFDGALPEEWIGGPEGAEAALTRMLDAGRVCLAADILGCCGSAVAMAVAYAKSRVQFGRPIGSFQAVKHLCAEMIADLEPARSLVWYAAHAFDAAPEEATLAAALAKSHLADIGGRIVRAATEVHGGIGFTEDCDLQLHFKRVQLDRQLLGGPQRLREVAARWQGWGSSSGTDRHRDP